MATIIAPTTRGVAPGASQSVIDQAAAWNAAQAAANPNRTVEQTPPRGATPAVKDVKTIDEAKALIAQGVPPSGISINGLVLGGTGLSGQLTAHVTGVPDSSTTTPGGNVLGIPGTGRILDGAFDAARPVVRTLGGIAETTGIAGLGRQVVEQVTGQPATGSGGAPLPTFTPPAYTQQGFTPGAAPTSQAAQLAPTAMAQQQAAIQAERAQAAQLSPTAMAQQQAPIQAGQAQAGLSDAGRISSTATAGAQPYIQAQQIAAAQIAQQRNIAAQQVDPAQAGRSIVGLAAQAGQSQIGRLERAAETYLPQAQLASDTQLAPTALSQAATIDRSQQEQFRQDQRGLVGGLQGAIAGTDPSVAAIMLRQATERNQANQYAMGQAANGQNIGLSQRQAMINAADVNQQSIGQQALLRAQEIVQNRQVLGGVLDQGRNTDVGLATNQAGLQQQTALANQQATNTGNISQFGADVQTKLANAGFTNTANMTQAQLSQAVALANASMANNQNLNQAQLDQQRQLANAGFQNNSQITQAQLDAGMMQFNAGQINQTGIANQGASLDASKTNVSLAQQAAMANQSASNTVGLANAGNQLAANQTNMTLAQQAALANAASLNNTGQVNAQLYNATGIANAGNLTTSNVANAGNVTNANTASSQLANAVAIANANNQSAENTAQGGFTNAANIANANNATNAAQTTSQLANALAIANANNQNSTNIEQGKLTNSTNQQNSVNQVNTAGQNITGQQNVAGNNITARGQDIQAQTAAMQAAAQVKAAQELAKAQNTNALIGGLATGAAAYIGSDRRMKTDVGKGDADIKKLLRTVDAYRFRYKDDKEPGASPGHKFGVMAQDLEKSRAGRSLIRELPSGRKGVDASQAAMVALAALGHMNKRLEAVER